MSPNVAVEPPSERAKPACESRPRTACYGSNSLRAQSLDRRLLLLALPAFEVLDYLSDVGFNFRALFGLAVQANRSQMCACKLQCIRAFLIFRVWIGSSLAEIFHSLQVSFLGRHNHRAHQKRTALVYREPFCNQESEHARACTFVRGSVQG